MATKKTPSKKKKSTAKWAKNSKDATEKAKKKMSWTKGAAAKKAPGFSSVKLKGIDGKKHTYQTRTDSRGRTRIVNNGQAAPEGYYPTGRGYYALKKNLRVLDSSPKKQKAFVAANKELLYGANPDGTSIGGIDRMGKGGQIHVDGGVVLVNFRKDTGVRNKMNKVQAFFDPKAIGHAGSKKAKMSKNIIAFGQDGREP